MASNETNAANGQDSQNPQPAADLRSNREYKSTVFTSYFGIPEHAAQLYEGLTRKYDLEKAQKEKKGGVQDLWNYSRKRFPSAGGKNTGAVSPKDIAFKTLEGVLYMARKNDMAFTVKDKILVIGEHQSTINRNMPLRSAIYYGRTMEQLVPARAIYKSQKLAIPTPEFFVFYNGKEPQPLEQTLSLSDSYIEKTASPMLELTVKVINVNLPAGHPILDTCRPLYEYSWFMWRVRENLRDGGDRDTAIGQAMEECVQQGIMTDYIQKHGSEVRNMLFTEFNLDDAKEVWEEEAREEGRLLGVSQGIAQGITQGITQGISQGKNGKLTEQVCKKLRKGKTAETIADELEEEFSEIQNICQIAAAFAPDYDEKAVLQALEAVGPQ